MSYQMQANTFALETLVAWLETKPADERYDFLSHTGCALAQYFTAQGFREVSVSPVDFTAQGMGPGDHRHRSLLPVGWNEVFNVEFVSQETFGAALERARRMALMTKAMQDAMNRISEVAPTKNLVDQISNEDWLAWDASGEMALVADSAESG